MDKNQIITYISHERMKEGRTLKVQETIEFLELMDNRFKRLLKREWKKFDEKRNGIILLEALAKDDSELSERNFLPKEVYGGAI